MKYKISDNPQMSVEPDYSEQKSVTQLELTERAIAQRNRALAKLKAIADIVNQVEY